MPNGIRHEELRKRGRWILFPAIFIPLSLSGMDFVHYGEWFIYGGILLGYEMGRYVTPDWDIMGTTSSEGWMVNELPVIGHFLFGISSIYGSIFRKYHRTWVTHFPGISTFVRHLLLFWWEWWQIFISANDLSILIFIFIGLFIGNSLADGIHWRADVTNNWSDE